MSTDRLSLFPELANASPMILRMVLNGEPLGIVARAENVDEHWLFKHAYFFFGVLELTIRDNLTRDWTKITQAEYDKRVSELSADEDETVAAG